LSFSSQIKNELCRIENDKPCCFTAELAAVVKISGIIKSYDNDKIIFSVTTENAAFARRLYSMIKILFGRQPEITIRRNKKLKKKLSYVLVTVASKDIEEWTEKTCCSRAFLRGAFLAGGSISDPEKTYHLEITSKDQEMANELNRIMNSYDLNSKVINRKSNYVTYLKEGENIVDFLNIIGAHNALLKLENIRILKEMRNSVNRIVNCETANLEKTVNASIRQIENITYINDFIGLHNIPRNLKEIAQLRLQHSEASLKELGEMLDPPLGKSGVNHRLRKLDKIAEDLRSGKLPY
jgi:DNA-binding protein WhiA